LEAVKVKDNMGPYIRSFDDLSEVQIVSETYKGWMEEDSHPSWE